jgi:hypothetical protein
MFDMFKQWQGLSTYCHKVQNHLPVSHLFMSTCCKWSYSSPWVALSKFMVMMPLVQYYTLCVPVWMCTHKSHVLNVVFWIEPLVVQNRDGPPDFNREPFQEVKLLK